MSFFPGFTGPNILFEGILPTSRTFGGRSAETGQTLLERIGQQLGHPHNPFPSIQSLLQELAPEAQQGVAQETATMQFFTFAGASR